jgi:hypothetical protein
MVLILLSLIAACTISVSLISNFQTRLIRALTANLSFFFCKANSRSYCGLLRVIHSAGTAGEHSPVISYLPSLRLYDDTEGITGHYKVIVLCKRRKL